jgi:hypothetical protein
VSDTKHTFNRMCPCYTILVAFSILAYLLVTKFTQLKVIMHNELEGCVYVMCPFFGERGIQ